VKVSRSPLAPARFPDLPPVAGVRLATCACEIKYRDRTDACLFSFEPGTTIAGVLTQSLTASAPVEWCRKILPSGKARAIVINSGNANAFTGRAGRDSVSRVVKASAEALGLPPRTIYVASTGVIGEPLPDKKLTGALKQLKTGLSGTAWAQAAEAIMGAAREPA